MIGVLFIVDQSERLRGFTGLITFLLLVKKCLRLTCSFSIDVAMACIASGPILPQKKNEIEKKNRGS